MVTAEEFDAAVKQVIHDQVSDPKLDGMGKLLIPLTGAIFAKDVKKLFISQPMKGKSDEEILAVREEAIKRATEMVKCDVEVIDSFFQDAPVEAKPLWYLAKSLELLAEADVAYFAEGWDEARGCKIEHECAVQYGIDRIEE